MNHLSKWTLKSLTIGPQVCETNTEFWVEAFKDLPPLRRVGNVTLAYHYPKSANFNTDFWEYMDSILSRRDLFPALKSVHVQSSCAQSRRDHWLWWGILRSFSTVRTRGIVPRKLFAPEWDGKLTTLHKNRVVLDMQPRVLKITMGRYMKHAIDTCLWS